MHILFLADNYTPEFNAPAKRTSEHVKFWISQGHNVTVITCAPNFPFGKVYPGYKNKLWSKEQEGSLNILRVWTFIRPNSGFFWRTLDFFSFAFMGFFAAFFVRNVDVIVGTSPQFFTTCSACLVSKVKKCPWVFELRDLWPQSLIAVGSIKKGRFYKLLCVIEKALYRDADLIICVTYSFKKILRRRGLKNKDIEVITNGMSLERIISPQRNLYPEYSAYKNKFVIGYLGTIGMAHKLDFLIEVAEIFREPAPDVHFLVVGEGSFKTELMQRSSHLSNFTVCEGVVADKALAVLSVFDVALTHLKAEKAFNHVIPSKIFEAMALGIPLLHGVKGESARLIRELDVGVCFEPEDRESFIRAYKALRSDRRRYLQLKNNCVINSKMFDRNKLADQMLKKLVSLVDDQ
jgi:glycosyltransferase involved in cell wall biosynthesis